MHGSRLRCAEEDRSAGARCKGSAFAQYAFCLVAYDRDWLRLAVDVGGRKTGSSSDKYAVSPVGTSLGSVVARVRVCKEKGTRGPISDPVGQMMIVTGTDPCKNAPVVRPRQDGGSSCARTATESAFMRDTMRL